MEDIVSDEVELGLIQVTDPNNDFDGVTLDGEEDDFEEGYARRGWWDSVLRKIGVGKRAVAADASKENLVVEGEGEMLDGEEQEEKTTKFSLFAVVFNFANSTIGAGVLGLPYVIKTCGIILGFLMVIAAAILGDYTLRLLHRCYEMSKEPAYEAIGKKIYGNKGANMVKIFVVILNLGALIAYQIVIGDLLVPVLWRLTPVRSFLTGREFVITVICFSCLLPLSLPKRIEMFRWTSLLSLFFVGCFSVIVVVKCIQGGFQGEVLLVRFSTDIFLVMGVAIFAFACHTNMVPIAVEVDWAHQKKIPKAIHVSTVTCFTAYAIVMTFGYLTHFENTRDNLLLSYQAEDTLLDVFRVLLSLTIILTFPLSVFPGRVSLDYLLFPSDRTSRPNLRHYLETFALVLVSWLVAVLVPSIVFVFNLTGAGASSFTSYIFPGLFFLKLKGTPITRRTLFTKDVFFPLFVIGLGVVVCIVGVTTQFVELGLNGFGGANVTTTTLATSAAPGKAFSAIAKEYYYTF